MKACRKASGGSAAYVALLLLLVQLFAAGFTAASHAAVPQVDAFGNVLCLSGEPGDPQDGSHGSLSDCCTFGCPNAGTGPEAVPEYPAAVVHLPVQTTAPVPFALPDVLAERHVRPGSPRAPPLSV